MGANMTRRLVSRGHAVVGHDIDAEPIRAVEKAGASGALSLEKLVEALDEPRKVWLMVPPAATETILEKLVPILSAGDVVVDGANSRFTDSVRRAEELSAKGINFVDAGVSGGVWGLEEGYCLMVGADPDVFAHLEPALADLAPEGGYLHAGPPGAGHFVKMVHNGIEYGMLQALGEGFELMSSADEFDLDLPAVADVWRHGSVIRSWLLDLLVQTFDDRPGLDGIRGWVDDGGTGRWTVEEAIDRSVPVPVISASLFARFSSRREDGYSDKLIAALRNQFGGHPLPRD